MQRKAITFAILTVMVGVGTVLSGCGDKKEVTSSATGNSQGQSSPFEKN